VKQKKEIEKLDTSNVSFPKANNAFDTYKARLRKVIEVNCGYAIAKSLEYDDYDQIFFVTLGVYGVLVPTTLQDGSEADMACVNVSREIVIDPSNPIGPQIDVINNTYAALQHRHNVLSNLLIKERLDKAES
jgi:hypothetical protein